MAPLRRIPPAKLSPQRSRPLLLEFGVRKRFARKHLIPHSGIVNEDCFYRRSLCKILGLEALVSIHVRVMSSCFVLDRILDELESRNPHCIE